MQWVVRRCTASFVIAAYLRSTPHSSGFVRLRVPTFVGDGAFYEAVRCQDFLHSCQFSDRIMKCIRELRLINTIRRPFFILRMPSSTFMWQSSVCRGTVSAGLWTPCFIRQGGSWRWSFHTSFIKDTEDSRWSWQGYIL